MSKKSLDELIEQSEVAIEKGESLDNFEIEHHGKIKEVGKSKEKKVAEKIKEGKQKKDEKEVVAESLELEEEKKEDKKTEKKEKKKKAKKGKSRIRSKKYQEIKALIDAKEKYDFSEALELVKKTTLTKFDGNIEVHIRILSKSGKPEQIRGLLQYPYATGKKVTVVILDDAVIEEIQKSGKANFDIALATPVLMPKVAKLAKILGPKGKMPSPKAGTVTENPEKTKADLEGGQVEYRADSYGNIHQVIGKVSGKKEELAENYKALLAVLPNDKIRSITFCATMGPAIKVKK